MSATIGNLDEICKFLDADVYTQNFRPVELVEYVKCGEELGQINWNATDEDKFFTFSRKLDFHVSFVYVNIVHIIFSTITIDETFNLTQL